MTVSPGQLPPAAQRRVAAAKESSIWSSSVAPGEEAALKSVGFEPVGTVTASLPSWPYGYRHAPGLVKAASRGYPTREPDRRGQYGTYYLYDDALTAKRAGGFTRDYVQGTQGGFIPDTGFSWEKVVAEARDRILVTAVMDRLRAEASSMAAHGIVSIKLQWQRRPDLDFAELRAYEVAGTGLAVRAKGAGFEQEPFSAALSGGDTCALLREGFAPAQLVFGVGIVEAAMGNRTRQHMRSLGQIEVPQFSEAVEKSLTIAKAKMERDAGDHCEAIVGCQPEVTFERAVGAGVQCKVRMIGTAVRRFRVPEHSSVLPILRLNG